MKVIPRKITGAHFIETQPNNQYGIYIESANSVNNRMLLGRAKENAEPEILKDLVEKYAYASALLYFVENFEIKNLNEKDLLEDINTLLHRRCKVVNEKAPLLTKIGSYPIYEGTDYILRGEGANKLRESFNLKEDINIDDIDLDYIKNHKYDEVIKDHLVCPKCKNVFDDMSLIVDYDEEGNTIDNTCPYCNFSSKNEDTFSDAWVQDLEDAPNADEMVPGIRQYIDSLEEEAEAGTQAADIASKVDYTFQSEPTGAKMLKYEAVEIKELDESTHLNLNGFIKDVDGLYKRGNYILVKESATGKLKVIHKSKLNEEVVQDSVKGGEFVAKTLETRLNEKFPDRFRIKHGEPDDEHYAIVITDNDNHNTVDLIDVTDAINAIMKSLKYDSSDYDIDYKGNQLALVIYNNKRIYSTDRY